MSGCKKLRFDCSLSEQLEQLNKPPDGRSCGPKNILIVEGSREDRQLSETNTALLERVWILSRPPLNLKDPQPTVSARRVQVVRSILDGEFQKEAEKKCPENPPCKESSSQGSTKASSKSVSMLGGV
ncbi:uncharacterized protein LOC142318022 [Lycorma delicatula]|uniref:uncharacterized protein LOC142318022 n=1 Tax=Lycorma delicatula TaxID=130591 RepID=UPI003F51761B